MGAQRFGSPAAATSAAETVEALRRELANKGRPDRFEVSVRWVYRQHRPMVERTIAWLVRGGARKVRYRGVARNDQWLHHRTAALNLRRMLTLGLTRSASGWAIA